MDVTLSDFFNSRKEFKQLDLTLDRISNALTDIGFSEKNLGKIVHIAGTNGKGSTAYYLAQMLRKDGCNVAMFTSPHIDDITERIQYNLENINYKDFQHLFHKNLNIIKKHALTFFEALTLIAFDFFSDKSPHISIIETGLGGRYDATNILNKKIPVITTISQDHIKFLGKNIYKIIEEKIAICKDNSDIFIGDNKNFINTHISKLLPDKNLYFLKDSENLDTADINFSLSSEIYKFITNKEIEIKAVNLKTLPCRMERIGNFTLDGAHNIAALYRIQKSKDRYDAVIFSCTNERDVETSVNILKTKAKKIYLTEIPDNDRSIDISNIDIDAVYRIKDPKIIIDSFLKQNELQKVLITGSLYFCAWCRKYIKGAV
ncbi:bifunctional folylpolyglutamate synthase/dihydrofolate synthase [Flexistipes sp.]|uniref:bifunctional folylpolyglutamate synthase/dihydrofolate synthase n=1 Tax=Flexistipes sp. TaxID=3088135 RepID=UPI002E22C0F7|nr:Mur ligase family protein [Flexistipes sp.]